jgi:Leucine-rich repeat (LRR) protein
MVAQQALGFGNGEAERHILRRFARMDFGAFVEFGFGRAEAGGVILQGGLFPVVFPHEFEEAQKKRIGFPDRVASFHLAAVEFDEQQFDVRAHGDDVLVGLLRQFAFDFFQPVFKKSGIPNGNDLVEAEMAKQSVVEHEFDVVVVLAEKIERKIEQNGLPFHCCEGMHLTGGDRDGLSGAEPVLRFVNAQMQGALRAINEQVFEHPPGRDWQVGRKKMYNGNHLQNYGLFSNSLPCPHKTNAMSKLALKLIAENKAKHARGEDASYLDLGNCGLTELPDLSGMEWLETLIVSNEWRDEKGEFVRSQNSGANNRLGSPSAGHLPQGLKRLSYAGDYYDIGPVSNLEFLQNLSNLTSLDLSYNQISDISFLESFTNLTELYLSSNRISDIHFLANLTNLTSLNMSYNQISDGRFLANLTNLTSLNLSDNKITDIPFLENLTNLTSLNLSYNDVSDRRFWENLTNLTRLDMSFNAIYNWHFLKNLTNLTWLSLGGNRISDGGFLENLTNLTTLDMRFNKISDVHFLEKMTDLISLDLSENKISDITAIKNLTLLNELTLHGNPVRDIPRVLLQGHNCLKYVKAWWAETANPDQTERNRCIKLMLNGNGNAGKSTLFHALRDGKCEKEMDSTHGILLDTWMCPMEPPVEFVIWDFGGQEIYHGTHRLFMASDAIQLLLIDPEKEAAANDKATSPDRITGEVTREQPLQYWIETTQELSPDSELMVVQNKKDVQPERYQPAYLKSAEVNLDYYHVSARRGDSIPLLQAAIHDKAQKLLDYGMPMPRSWVAARQHFLDNLQKPLPERERLLLKTEFFRRCLDIFGVKEMAIPALLKLLHYTGIVYYNEEFLDDIIIADQRWALEAIYKPLDRKSDFYNMLRKDTYGKTRVITLFSAFGDAYKEQDKWLFLHFMRSCGLCFPMLEKRFSTKENEDAYYVFPEFLPAEMSNSAQLAWTAGAKKVQYFRRQYDYLNYYRIQSFIARLGQKTNMESVWRNGILILTDDGNFKVYADYENDAVVVAIEERAQNKWLREILEEWEGREGDQEFKDWEYSEDGQNYAPANARVFSNKAVHGFDKPNGPVQKKSLFERLPDVPANRPLLLVASYAKEDRWAVEAMKKHLSGLRQEGKIEFWYDQKLDGRAFWDDEIKDYFDKADGYLAFVSPNYVDDEVKNYIHREELPVMMKRKKEARIPTYCITVTAVDYGPVLSKFDFFSDKKAIPRDEAAMGEFLSRFVKEIVRGKLLKTDTR